MKGTVIGIADDFPKEIVEIHRKLFPVLKKAKQAKQSTYFEVNKLIINGQVYRGKEAENLEHRTAQLCDQPIVDGELQRKHALTYLF